ncbi:MAG: hypothetical protein ABFD81_15090 [Syntrophaceae bacterium]
MNRRTLLALAIGLIFCILAGLFLLSLKGYIPLTYTQVDTFGELEAFLDSPRDDMRGIKVNGHFLEIGKRRALQILPGYKDVFYQVRPYRQVQYIPRNMTRAEIVDMCLSINGQGLEKAKIESLKRPPNWQGSVDGRPVRIMRITRFTYLVSGLSDKSQYIAQVELAKRLGMTEGEILSRIIPLQASWLRSLAIAVAQPVMKAILPEVPDQIVIWLNTHA